MSRPTPLYQQVRDDLFNRITNGEIQVGDRLEPEIELAVSYQVSRATMRNAIRDLVQAGLLTRRPGVGTMVVRAVPEIASSKLDSLIESLLSTHAAAQLLVLDSGTVSAPADVAEALGVNVRSKVLRVFRICKIDSVPAAVCRTWLLPSIGVSSAEVRVAPLYDLVEHTYARPLSFGRDSISAGSATGETARLLDLKPGSPLLNICRTAYDGSNQPVLYSQVSFNHSFYRYEVTLPRQITRA